MLTTAGLFGTAQAHQTREGGSACFPLGKVGGATVQPKKVEKDGLQAGGATNIILLALLPA